MTPPLGLRHLRVLRAEAVRAFAERARADVIIERYHNFGGEGMRAARALGALAVLEVNAPVIDYPGSPKARLDQALLVEPMRRWRDRQCRMADLLVTPAAEVLPGFVPRDRIVEIEWGADTDRFVPGAGGPVPFARRPGAIVAVFAGAFRAWHGAITLVRAMRALRAAGLGGLDAVLIGDGPELARAQAEAEGIDGVTFTGAVRSRPDAGGAGGGGHRRRAVRRRRAPSAATGLLLVAAEGVRVHGGRPAGGGARHPAPRADPRARPRAPALRRARGRAGSRTRSRTRPATATSGGAWATRPDGVCAPSSAGRRTAGQLDEAMRQQLRRRGR